MTDGGHLKVVHLTSVHPPFDSRIFHKECRSLAARGLSVSLIAVHDRHEVVDGVKIIPLPKPSSRAVRMTLTMARLVGAALKERADIYHFHDPELLPAGILLRAFGRVVVYDVHEDMPLAVLGKAHIPDRLKPAVAKALAWSNRLAETSLSGIVAVTPSVASAFKQPTLVRNFPMLSEFPESESSQEPSDKDSAAYVGVISRLRGFWELVEATQLVRVSHPGFQLYLAGRPAEHEIEEYFAVSGTNDATTHLGILDRKEVAQLLGSCRVGLVTLSGDHEAYRTAYPIKMFEYMAAGLPVVASHFPVYREIVEGNGCGIVVDPADPAAIAKAIVHLLDNPEHAAEMGRRGRAAVWERYNWDTEVDALIDLYHSLSRSRG